MTDSPTAAAGPEGAAPATPEDRAPGRRCTQAQLRRFIKSRAYIPMHELRRRFELNGAVDEMAAVRHEGRLIYVGLPEREARMLAELLRQGEVGVELSFDPHAAVAVGVYAMRPVPRP
jgi:hypothetical protein